MTDTETKADATPRRNSRRHRRQPPKQSTKVRAFRNALGLGPNIASEVLDLSESGVRLLLTENLRAGTEFEVSLESAAHKPVRVLAQIVWSVATAQGLFVVGASFQKALPYATLQALSRS